MIGQRHLLAVIGGGVGALFFLWAGVGTAGGLFLSYFAQLPLFAVGLGLGFGGALLASAVALAIILAVIGAPILAALFVATTALPVLIVTRQGLQSRTAADGATEWYPPGLILAALTAVALATLLVAELALAGAEGGLEGELRRLLSRALEAYGELGLDRAQLDAVVDTMARLAPGAVGASWLIMISVNATLAQWALARFGRNIRPSPRFWTLELPGWMTGALVLAALLAMLSGGAGHFGRNALVIVATPFLLLGLAIIHAVSARWTGRIFGLIALYAMLVASTWPAVPIALLAVAERWLQLRRRYGAPPPKEEEEE